MNIKCSRCGAVMKARSEHESEVKFASHECKGKRPLSDLPLDLLRKLAYKTITEAQAWAEMEKRNGH